MGALLGKPKKKSRISDIDRSILSLKGQRDQLGVYRVQLESKYNAADANTKSLLKDGKKTLALLSLKARNRYGVLIEQAETNLLQINQLISNVEVASLQREVVAAIEKGTSALKTIQKDLSVDYVQRIMDDNAEATGSLKEVADILGGTVAEDDSVMQELEKMQEEIALAKAAELPSVPAAPLPDHPIREESPKKRVALAN